MLSELWDRLWKSEQEFYDSGQREFRHDASFVAVSSIAEQYYCEYKLENAFTLGEIPTETKESGTALHDELMPTERISKEEFVKLVSKEEPTLAVLGVWGSVGGLKVVGVPDHIIWSGGKPMWVVELKTTRGDPIRSGRTKRIRSGFTVCCSTGWASTAPKCGSPWLG